ncbi:MAG: hypothetical protein DRJ39_03105 [Thermoprotei archaeon]|nr:MAG: hypothetical protein DRJ39_03105 [Thermoprotei archaeon]
MVTVLFLIISLLAVFGNLGIIKNPVEILNREKNNDYQKIVNENKISRENALLKYKAVHGVVIIEYQSTRYIFHDYTAFLEVKPVKWLNETFVELLITLEVNGLASKQHSNKLELLQFSRTVEIIFNVNTGEAYADNEYLGVIPVYYLRKEEESVIYQSYYNTCNDGELRKLVLDKEALVSRTEIYLNESKIVSYSYLSGKRYIIDFKNEILTVIEANKSQSFEFDELPQVYRETIKEYESNSLKLYGKISNYIVLETYAPSEEDWYMLTYEVNTGIPITFVLPCTSDVNCGVVSPLAYLLGLRSTVIFQLVDIQF